MALKKRLLLLIPVLLFVLVTFPAWGQQKEAASPAGQADQMKQLKEENLALRKRVMSLEEQNEILTENLMRCMDDLGGRPTDKSEQPSEQPRESK